jgi:glycosyltransferase involved in cell wall biosynthesis
MLAPFVGTPVLTTLHGPFDDHNREFFRQQRGLPFVSISHAQREACPDLRYVRTIYHGIETGRFQLARKQGYLLYLARLSPEKGTHLAVEVARRAGKPLIIAGKVDPVDRGYFETQVRPLIDGDQIRFIGEVGGQTKATVIAGADALLHPVQWPEPFGLALVEAMAAGTPVVAFPRGSIPELIEDGLTGFVVRSVDEMCAAVARAAALDPTRCRDEAVRRFDARRMVAEYVEAYEQVAGTSVYSGNAAP